MDIFYVVPITKAIIVIPVMQYNKSHSHES